MNINVIQDFFFNNKKNEKANGLYFKMHNGIVQNDKCQL